MFAASLLLSAGVSFVSCSDENDPNGGKEEETPLLEGEVIKGNDTPTPIKCYEGETPLTDFGVQIIPGVTLDNELRFECIPGPSAKSYRLDIIPLAKAYDMIYSANYDDINNGKVMTIEETAQAIKDLLFAEGGTAGYTFAPSDKMTDYATGHEFNWVADGYMQGGIVVPDAEYLIVAVGCSDENGANGRDMSISCVKTTPKDLIGDPIVKVKGEVKRGWSAFGFDMEANEDAKYYYVFPIGTKDMNNYLDKYGEKTFVDMIRFSQYPNDATSSNMSVQYPLWLDPSENITIITIGADENYVVNDMQKTSFYMPQKPADRQMPSKDDCTVTCIEESTSASVVNFKITFPKHISLIRYRLMSKSEWEAMKDDKEAQAKLASDLTYNGGWVERNPNYKLKATGEDDYEVIGEAGSTTSKQYIIPEGSENYLVWTCQNGFEDYTTELNACYFKTKSWKRSPEITEGLTFNPYDASTTGITISVTPSDNIAFYYHKIILDDREFDLNTEEGLAAAYDYMFDEEELFYNFTDPWAYPKGTPEWEEQNTYPYLGLEQGKEYRIMLIGETWDGALIRPMIEKVKTAIRPGGNNPQMTIEDAKYEKTEWSGTFSVTYKPNDDVRMYYYGIFGLDKENMKGTYKEEVAHWKEILVNGVDGTGNPFKDDSELKFDKQMMKYSWDTLNDYYLAMCLPFGSTDDIVGELSMVVFDKNNEKIITNLRELWPDAPVSDAATTTAIKPVSVNQFTATERIKKNQEEAEAFLQSLRKIRGFDKYQWTPSIKAPAPISINGEPVVK